MKILVTGGCGFIGTNYIRHLAQEGNADKVFVLDKITYAANGDNIGDINRVKLIIGDMCDRETVSRIFDEDIDYVVSFASNSHVDRSFVEPHEFMHTNILGVSNLLNVARDYSIKKIILFSTDEVYGSIEEGSFKESDRLNPTNPYSTSKACADLIALSYYAAYSMPLIIARCVNNFGPFQHVEKVIPKFITDCIENRKLTLHDRGQHVRSWIHVHDTFKAVDALLQKGKAGETYNISAGNEKTCLELAKLILKKFNKDESNIVFVRDRKNNDYRYSLNNEKLKSLGWKPECEFEEALGKTAEWYIQNRQWWEKLR